MIVIAIASSVVAGITLGSRDLMSMTVRIRNSVSSVPRSAGASASSASPLSAPPHAARTSAAALATITVRTRFLDQPLLALEVVMKSSRSLHSGTRQTGQRAVEAIGEALALTP